MDYEVGVIFYYDHSLTKDNSLEIRGLAQLVFVWDVLINFDNLKTFSCCPIFTQSFSSPSEFEDLFIYEKTDFLHTQQWGY